MPNFYDFDKLKNIKTIEVNPSNWVNPLFIEYGIEFINMPMCCWKVKGTRHTFTIPVTRLDFISSGDYKQHFTEALEGFFEEYDGWRKKEFVIPWQREYYQEYSRYIL